MNFLTYLYYKYYRFQVRVGNGDIALYTPILFMIIIAILYYGSILLFVLLISPNKSWDVSNFVIVGILVISVILLFWCWLRVWREKRYKKIIEYYERFSPKSSLGAILVALGSFLLYLIGGALMLLRNNGII